MKTGSIFLLGILLLVACVDSEICSTKTTSLLNFSLIDTTFNEVQDSNLYALHIRGIGNDSVFVQDTFPKAGQLFLNPYTDTCAFMLDITDRLTDYWIDTLEFDSLQLQNLEFIDTLFIDIIESDTIQSQDTLAKVRRWNYEYEGYQSVLTFYYERSKSYLNDACGFTFTFSIDSIKHTTLDPISKIDSVQIDLNKIFLDAEENHLSFFIRTAE